ncbi:GNAT family N-acetyltransferase [Legionella pneumophila]|uniref:Acetyltransferase n=1 Tax=Legionella pneumophila subsp. pascullei TaxID=91890 RepID=A0AAX2IW19_LEGPN|nr:GNAT family N-acetyltransferase [Legionella pneumophila]AMP90144.1 N-acetyltransferase [Legionella pneumophila subsp. pascullei]AMP92188.1 GCN5 family acetyltransferase [Legionella pneumophila subsp. pascullei]AMP95153.1 GCN5 family acetyltransferase [Legionella pneumophila subsp. pascullei]SQG90036.1 Acetyltransferase [Legionella pneumophila subsp. pascullei]VEH05906.1 Acetyltransferase [Legionella pneumophila subsp. pascullei]
MLLFSLAMSKHKLTFTKLSECMEYLELAAKWAEDEWGYIRNKGVEFRKEVLSDLKEHTYIGTFNGKPIAMFVLFDKDMSLELNTGKFKPPVVSELMYVYIDKSYRGLGFGKQIIDEAKRLAQYAQSEYIMLDTLKPCLNRFYEKSGAKVIAENQLFSHPTDVLTIKI